MRAVSAWATVALVAATLQLAAQQPPRAAQPRPRTPATPAPKRAPAAPAPAARQDAAVPFKVGETLTYDVGWSNYLVAGSAVSRVVDKRTAFNSSAYYIVAEGRPLPLIARIYALYYKMDSLMDSVTTLSQRTSLYTEEGARKRSATTIFDRGARRAQFAVQSEQALEFPVPANVQDGLATLYALRGRTFKAGERVSIPVADEGLLYTAHFDVTGPESVKVPLGVVNAWNLRVTILDYANQPVGKNIAAWISADARRLPVRLQADLPVGNFALALRSAQ
ncbi:MAG TPA: DUF3108 domain-containing protein [Vicinamibacterales bacterium]|nr:DUF3108 domain-containing protein [Vicinamibacterales bacterium]